MMGLKNSKIHENPSFSCQSRHGSCHGLSGGDLPNKCKSLYYIGLVAVFFSDMISPIISTRNKDPIYSMNIHKGLLS